MLKGIKTVETEVALDDCGGHVMLTLKDGDDKFCQALSATDVGKVLCAVKEARAQVVCCEGDLVADYNANAGMLKFLWHAEGRDCLVKLGSVGIAVFITALKHYCALLMRTNKGV
jgi:hypothetical protein